MISIYGGKNDKFHESLRSWLQKRSPGGTINRSHLDLPGLSRGTPPLRMADNYSSRDNYDHPYGPTLFQIRLASFSKLLGELYCYRQYTTLCNPPVPGNSLELLDSQSPALKSQCGACLFCDKI